MNLVIIRSEGKTHSPSPVVQGSNLEEALDWCLGCICAGASATEGCTQGCLRLDSSLEPLLAIGRALFSLPKVELSDYQKRKMLTRIVNSMYQQAN